MLTGDDLRIESPKPVEIRGRNARALLVLLALEAGRPVSRDRIAGILWPESDQASARSNLRQALMILRRAFEPVGTHLIDATAETVALRLDPDQVDCLRFARLTARQDPDSRIGALELYTGNLLERMPGVSAEFDYQLQVKREELRARAIDTGRSALGSLDEPSDTGVRIAARAMLAADPTNEPAHRALMRFHFAAGDRAAALYQFELCRAALNELDTGLGPEPETLALRDEIARASQPADANGVMPATDAVVATPSAVTAEVPLPRTGRRARIVGTGVLMLAAASLVVWFIRPQPPCPPPHGVQARLALFGPEASDESELHHSLRLALWRIPEIELTEHAWLPLPASRAMDAYRILLLPEPGGVTYRLTLLPCDGSDTMLLTGRYQLSGNLEGVAGSIAGDVREAIQRHRR